ncbi:unnamed protein product [Blepharisma stoltei]|uniref:Uncharacterized protein n=1 Tax=Blepharisma stoltei TaxID=1481888 RepID=A0AAU9JSN6_9CILI|nr:unnamed protein product [Blepharisma stoltei]
MRLISKERSIGFISSILNTKSKNRYEEIVKSLINYLVDAFHPHYSPKTSYRVQIIVEACNNLLQNFQVVSIFWYPVKTPHKWDDNSSIWRILNYSNYDNICQESSIYEICFYAEIFTIFFGFFVIILAWLAKFYMWKISKQLKYFSKVTINILVTAAFIPSLKILLIIFKYSTFNTSLVQEYLGANKEDYNYGLAGSILCFVGIGLLFLMVFSYELLSADLKHSNYFYIYFCSCFTDKIFHFFALLQLDRKCDSCY